MNYLNPATSEVRSLWQTYAALIQCAGAQRAQLVRCLLWAAASAALFGAALPLFYPVLRALAAGQSPREAGIPALCLLAASMAARIRSERYDTAGYANRAVHELRSALGEKLRRIAPADLGAQRSGEIAAVLVQSVNEAAAYAFTLLTVILYALVTPMAAALTLLWFDARFALLTLLVFPLAMPLYLWRRRAFRRGFSLLAEANAALKGEAVEFIQGMDVLKSAGRCQAGQTRFIQTAHDVAEIQRIGTKKGQTPNLIITTTLQGGLIAVVALGVYLTARGQAEALLLAAVLVLIARTAEALNFFVQMTSLLEIFVIGSEKLQHLLSHPELSETDAPAETPRRFDIAFERISYAYPGQSRPALRDITLHVPEGGMTALAGSSGSGKSTLARLIFRYDDVDAGSVKIGGVDVRALPQRELMRLISVVFQDVYLFRDSVLNNIRMARPEASDAEVIRAAERAQCHDFISALPEGYQTVLADTGSSLSGGEKQRIAIARAILKDAPILILDEPTAALDAQNKRAVQKALDALIGEKTVLVIAHRLATIAGARQIVVLEQGAILETGDHASLLAADGRYAQFWRMQRAGEAMKAGAT